MPQRMGGRLAGSKIGTWMAYIRCKKCNILTPPERMNRNSEICFECSSAKTGIKPGRHKLKYYFLIGIASIAALIAWGDYDEKNRLRAMGIETTEQISAYRKEQKVIQRANDEKKRIAENAANCGKLGGMAELRAMGYTRTLLKSPSSASFGTIAARRIDGEGCIWRVTGDVDAQNAFGAMLRRRFVYVIRYSPDTEKWTPIDASLQ